LVTDARGGKTRVNGREGGAGCGQVGGGFRGRKQFIFWEESVARTPLLPWAGGGEIRSLQINGGSKGRESMPECFRVLSPELRSSAHPLPTERAAWSVEVEKGT